MEKLQEKIGISVDEILNTEKLIGDELRQIIYEFKEEKKKTGFSFGTLCIIHYKEHTDFFNEEIYLVAAAIELIILSSDIIDDLQDQDTDYIWTKAPALSLNAVLAMLKIASKVISNSTFKHRSLALKIVDEYILLSINGQQLDLLNACQDESSYLNMIEQKSGSLTAMSCLVGFGLASGTISTQVEKYAKAIGVIQQIKNDFKDLTKWSSKNDLINRKYSLPIIYLLSQNDENSAKIKKYYNKEAGINILDKPTIENILLSKTSVYILAIKNIYKNKSLPIIKSLISSEESKSYLINLMK